MGELHLIRHGQASAGAADYDDLSPLGWEQARLLGVWFGECGQSVARVVTGRMRRHRQTAQAFLAALPSPQRPDGISRVDPGFDEYDREDVLARYRDTHVRRTVPEKEMAAAVRRWAGGHHDADYREDWPSFRARCLSTLDRLNPEGVTLVFTSAGAIGVLTQQLLGLPKRRAVALASVLTNGAVTRVTHDGERWSLRSFNGFAPLERAGRPELISRW